MNNNKDQLYRSIDAPKGSFVFDQRVVNVFNDMIARSVPGYQQILEMLPIICRRFSQSGDNYYDLGCSLGAGILAMSQGLNESPELTPSNRKFIGIDNSREMIEQAQTNLSDIKVDLIYDDLLNVGIQNAAMVLMNFTLQFIALEHRDELLHRVYQGLGYGGGLILSEKVHFNDEATDELLTDLHHRYKASQGYSKLEIAKKRDAIVDVLIPETMDAHIFRLEKAGFKTITPWVQNLQFISILAVK